MESIDEELLNNVFVRVLLETKSHHCCAEMVKQVVCISFLLRLNPRMIPKTLAEEMAIVAEIVIGHDKFLQKWFIEYRHVQSSS